MANETILVLSGIGVPPYSARGLSQTLVPIDAAADLRRTVNGVMVNLSLARFQKYRSTISGNDQEPPSVDGIWQGQVVTVDCISELAYPTGRAGSPHRTVVSGSSHVEGSFTFYRPQLTMMVTAYNAETDEYGATISWELELEEV